MKNKKINKKFENVCTIRDLGGLYTTLGHNNSSATVAALLL